VNEQADAGGNLVNANGAGVACRVTPGNYACLSWTSEIDTCPENPPRRPMILSSQSDSLRSRARSALTARKRNLTEHSVNSPCGDRSDRSPTAPKIDDPEQSDALGRLVARSNGQSARSGSLLPQSPQQLGLGWHKPLDTLPNYIKHIPWNGLALQEATE
jgi:hypothetical protein